MDTKRSKSLFLAIIIAAILLIPIVVGALQSFVTLNLFGTISDNMTVTAKSGNTVDIQAAVNTIANNGGIGTVIIPDGTFNFVNIGQSWSQVTVPAGINIIAKSAPTMDPNWDNRFPSVCKTILKLPYDVPSGSINSYDHPTWFYFEGSGDTTKPSRFSGIKLQGYRSIDPTSVYILNGVSIWQVMDFRVDHCIFENIAGGNVADGGDGEPGDPVPDHYCRGVFDHNKFINTIGYCDAGMYDDLTVCYGVQPFNFNSEYWDPNEQNIMGKYTTYSIYMEDNYFSKWRHCISAGSGIHAVFRHNVIEYDYANGGVDVHGQGLSYLGGRVLEVYDNTMINAVSDGGYDWDGVYHSDKGWPASNNVAINFRGGAGLIFNNYVDDTYAILAVILDEEPSHLGGYVEDLYIWNNSGTTELSVDGPVLNTDYFLYKPSWYTSYVYPHPLVSSP